MIMASLQARKGRLRQRYEDQLRLVAGCIPYKFEKNDENKNCKMEKKVLVLMISTPNRDDLVFPKGGWEDDETVSEAACREALEEAGVRGLLDQNPLGVWEFRSKSRMNSCNSKEGGCRGYMFALEVTEELESWPEQANYKRIWLSVEEAFKSCRYDWMIDALKKFLLGMNTERTQLCKSADSEDSTAKEHQMYSPTPGCSVKKPSGVHHQLEKSCTNDSVVQV
ncbi:hypothetical protein CUMW_053250 [Citrus unshiu]|nr:hypothetical protein CUMW_053250 [Citrus unshiu]